MVITEAVPAREDRDLACLTRGLAADHQPDVWHVKQHTKSACPSVLIDSIVHNAEGTRSVPFLGRLFRYDPQLSYFHFARRRFFLLLLLCRACEFLSAAPASAY